ncbi:MAG: hypothetical protein WDZ81_01500 [Candidatus Saccharimonadales bacterium]
MKSKKINIKSKRKIPPAKDLLAESVRIYRKHWKPLLLVGLVIGQSLQLLFSSTDGLWGWLWFVITFAALVWLVQNLGSKKATVKNAYYQGTAYFIKTALVSAWLLIMFLPAFVGQALLLVISSPQMAATAIETTLAYLAWFLLLGLSLYLLIRNAFALIIVNNPKEPPISAIKKSLRITKSNTKALAWRLLPLGLIALIVSLFFLLLGYFLPLEETITNQAATALTNGLVTPLAVIYLYKLNSSLNE